MVWPKNFVRTKKHGGLELGQDSQPASRYRHHGAIVAGSLPAGPARHSGALVAGLKSDNYSAFQGRQYGQAEIALRDALMFASGLP